MASYESPYITSLCVVISIYSFAQFSSSQCFLSVNKCTTCSTFCQLSFAPNSSSSFSLSSIVTGAARLALAISSAAISNISIFPDSVIACNWRLRNYKIVNAKIRADCRCMRPPKKNKARWFSTGPCFRAVPGRHGSHHATPNLVKPCTSPQYPSTGHVPRTVTPHKSSHHPSGQSHLIL